MSKKANQKNVETMKKIGLFYGAGTAKTSIIAWKIQEAFGDNIVDIIPIENAWQKEFQSYDNIIAGTSTWFDGELPNYWDEILPELDTVNLKGKKVAIFGLGNQVDYPDNFVDGIGILAEQFTDSGAMLVGLTSAESYKFIRSRAFKNGKFLGLAIDVENQSDMTEERIIEWVKQLRTEFDDSYTSTDDSFNC